MAAAAPKAITFCLTKARSAGYSCLKAVDDETLGILHEGSVVHMTFQRIFIADLLRKDP